MQPFTGTSIRPPVYAAGTANYLCDPFETRTHDSLTGENRQVWTGQSGQYGVNGPGKWSARQLPGASFHSLETVR